MQELSRETPIQVAVFLGLATLAAMVYFSLIHAGKGLRGKQQELKNGAKGPVVVTFFSDTSRSEATKGISRSSLPAAAPEFKKMMLISKYNDTHDTIVLRFALPHHGRCCQEEGLGHEPSSGKLKTFEVAGIAPARHVQIRAKINNEMVQRSFSPTSCAVDEAHCGLMDLHVKVYRPSPEKGFPTGGVMSCYLDSLPIGSTVDIRGPTGIVEYIGNGAFITGASSAGRRVVGGRHLIFIAGGSGITPIVSTLKAILHGKLGGMRPPHIERTNQNESKSAAASVNAALPDSRSTPTAGREYLRGECRHSFYTPSPVCVSETSNEIERITFVYVNHSIEDIMFSDWLLGDDAEHSCYGAFAALAEAGGVEPQSENLVCSLPDNFVARPIDVSMTFFITRPSEADLKTISEFNVKWKEEEAALLQKATNVRTSTPDGRPCAIVTRRFVVGRPTADSIVGCLKDETPELSESNERRSCSPSRAPTENNAQSTVREKIRSQLSSRGVDTTDCLPATVALLCGPPGLLNGVARPALLSSGLQKDKILLA